MMRSVGYVMRALPTAFLAMYVPAAMAQVSAEACGDLTNGVGPFDYRTESAQIKHTIEHAHFTPAVEALIRGNTSRTASGDLDYTLRAFPNHHRALASIYRWTQRDKTPNPSGLGRPAECYFERAVRWKKDDVIVRMLYAQFLYFHKRSDDARTQLETARQLAPDNALTQYNIGLVHFEGGDHALALEQAHRAYAMGMQRPELRDLLKAAGQWKDAEPADAPASGASAAAR